MLRGTITYVRSPEVTAKEFGPALAAGNAAVIDYWHEAYMPAHFTAAGAQKYGYTKRLGEDEPEFVRKEMGKPGSGRWRMVRNQKYYWAKWQKFKTREPLLKTGAAFRGARTIKISATSKTGTGSFPSIPKYFWYWRKRKDGTEPPHKGEELIVTTEDEVQSFVPIHQNAVTKYLDSIKTTETAA